MVNKTIKAVVSALVIMPSLVWAAGNSVAACGNSIGNNTSMSGTVECNQKPGQAKRGDKVVFTPKFMQQFNKAQQLSEVKSFKVPQPGSYAFYKLGTIKLLIGTFDLNADNSSAPRALQTILRDAKAANKEANSLIWFGRALEGQAFMLELAEVTSDLKNPTGAPIRFEITGAASVTVYPPFQSQPIMVNANVNLD